MSATAPTTVSTRALLTCVAVAAPLWSTVSLAQAATRENFDLTRHPLSMLANGSLGWLQITNFILFGVLSLVGAVGQRRALHGTAGSTWAPRLVRITGLGLIGAGVFVMDPADGFPTGTPAGVPTTYSPEMMAHLIAGSIAFIAIIGTCYVLGRHLSRIGRRGQAVASRLAGSALLAGNGWAMSGGAAGSLTLAIGFITAVLWIAWVSGQYRSNA